MDQPYTEAVPSPRATRLSAETDARSKAAASASRGSLSGTTAKQSLSETTAKRSMNFSEAVAIATSSLWAHKLRSVLTLLGVVIGVAAVIAVGSLINGAGPRYAGLSSRP